MDAVRGVILCWGFSPNEWQRVKSYGQSALATPLRTVSRNQGGTPSVFGLLKIKEFRLKVQDYYEHLDRW